MKIFKNLILLTALFCVSLLILNCARQKAPKTVTVPFTADALGEYKYFGPDTLPSPKCTDSIWAFRIIVDAKGTGNPIGNFTVHFDFCSDAEGNYGNCFAYLVAENGDTLFIEASGQVFEGRLDEHPEFVTSYWRDPSKMIGGTGKYKGATGSVMGDDYNSSEDPYSHHHWKGTLTLVEEKK